MHPNDSPAWNLLGKDYDCRERRGTRARKNIELTRRARQQAKRELEELIDDALLPSIRTTPDAPSGCPPR